MPYSRPTLPEIVTRISTDIKSRLNIIALLRRSTIGVLSRAFAGAIHSLFGYAAYIADQIIWDTADGDFLVRWASIFGISPTDATFADGNVTFTGTNGTVVPAGTIIQTSDSVQYSTDSDVTITGGSGTVAVTCLSSGATGNLDAGEMLSLVSPIAGIATSVTVAAGGIDGGTDTESTEDLRARFLERVRLPPTGGSVPDYIFWSKQVAGVTRVWVYPNVPTTNEVTVLFVRDNDGSGVGADIFPSAGEIQDVQDVLDVEVPITALAIADSPVSKDLDLDITITPDTTEIRAAVTAELQDLINREAEPGGAYNAVNNGTILLSHIREAISRATGENNNIVNLVNGGAPADATVVAGEMYILGTVTFS